MLPRRCVFALVRIFLLFGLAGSQVAALPAVKAPAPPPVVRASSAATPSLAATTAPPRIQGIAYTVALPKPWTHLLEVTLQVRRSGAAPAQNSADLILPVWTPGSYLLREFARNVQDFEARDAAGQALPWRKVDKCTWRVGAGKSGAFTVHYRIYADEPEIQSAEVTARHAFWNNTAVLMSVRDERETPATLSIRPPVGWKVATNLSPDSTDPLRFRAADVDTLYDCPIEVGVFTELDFSATGRPHRLIVDGKGDFDPATLTRDLTRIAETEAALLGPLSGAETPYTIFLHLRRDGESAGLEHRDGCALRYPQSGFGSHDEYLGFLRLFTHEYFHQWNGKRLCPAGLEHPDYTRENYTRLLWMSEGITHYYENVFLRRAGFLTADEYLAATASEIGALTETPGRLAMSAEEASFDAWVKQYRPNGNSVNAAVSYYVKGAALGLLLDLTLREKTGGTRSLDDVMRQLWAEYRRTGNPTVTPEGFQRACEQSAGGSLETLFALYVRGRQDLPFDGLLAGIGLRLQRTPPDASPLIFLGAQFAANVDAPVISAVPEGTPAYDQGLSPGDRIDAVDGGQVATQGDVLRRLRRKRPGDTVALTVVRSDETRILIIRLEGRPPVEYRLLPLNVLTAQQRRLLENWVRETRVAPNPEVLGG